MKRTQMWGPHRAHLLVSAATATVVSLALVAGLPARPAAAGEELLVNGGFDAGTADPWWNSETTTAAVVDGRLRVDVPAGTGEVWEAMAGQSGVALTGGTEYVLSFDAYAATAGTPMHARIQPASSPSTTVFHEQVSLATASQRFEFPFTAGQSVTDGQVVFQLGGQDSGITVFLDDISLTPAVEELLVNGGFDGGTADPWWNSETTTATVVDGQLRVDVPAGAAEVWEASAGQSGVALTSGTEYELSFDAYAAAAGTALHARVQPESAPSTTVVHQQVALTTTSQRFEVAFTAGQSIADAQVVLQLGGQDTGITVYLDNISLTATAAGGGPGGPIEMTNGFYVDPNSNPAVWVRNNGGDSRAPVIDAAIASKPMARWFGDWNADISAAVSGYVSAAEAADRLPILVTYNMYHRDCGGPSGGGAASPAAYRSWISAFAAAIGDRPAIVVIEPDATAQFDCLDAGNRATRLDLLTYATEQFRDLAPNTWAYLDAGNANWPGVAAIASRLPDAGLSNIRGFSVNVSNFYTTGESIGYANALNSAMGTDAPFVIDTSRNGNGSNGEWCNPPGRRLGTPTQVGGGAEMLLWVKVPGDSDGNTGADCDPGKPPAGQFSPTLAMELIGDGGGQPSSFPDATNTGVPPGTTLQPSGGLTITEDNTVIDGLDIDGCVQVRADNVTIKRSRVRCGDFHVIRMHNDHHGLLVEDVEIDGMGVAEKGIGYSNYTLRRAHIHNLIDGAAAEDNTVVEDSYIHHLADCETCHNDGIQSTGGANTRIRHNTILNPNDGTSCIILGDEFRPLDDVIVENNYLNGGAYTIYVGVGTTSPNVIIRNNHFGRDNLYGLLSATEPQHVQWTTNIWHDTNQLIRKP